MSLYLKYRPQDFKTLVGQDHAKKTIQSAVANDRLAHAYLFSGPRGTGKTSLARILAKRINCLNPKENEPCNACEICQAITAGRLVDLIEIDAASNRGIDEIRELREKIKFSPSQAKSKVYIIDEVHMLTKEAFNALLKTLEEPPSHAYFILATTEAHKIPDTIVSRCQQFSFGRIEVKNISQRLKTIAEAEEAEFEEESLELIAKLSEGGLRDAIGLLEQMILGGKVTTEKVNEHLGLTGTDHLSQFFQLVSSSQTAEAIGLLEEVLKQGKSPAQFTKEWLMHLREQLLVNVNDQNKVIQITQWVEYFLKAKTQIDLSPIPQLPLEVAIVKSCKGEILKAKSSKNKEEEKASEMKAEKTEVESEIQKKETPAKEVQKKETALTLKEIQKNWPRVIEMIQAASIKLSLAQGKLTDFKEGKLSLCFESETFKEKITPPNVQGEIESLLKTVFNEEMQLNLETQEVKTSKINVEINKIDEGSNKKSVVEMAADVFGTE